MDFRKGGDKKSSIESCFTALLEVEGIKDSRIFRDFVFDTSLRAGCFSHSLEARVANLESTVLEQKAALANTNRALIASTAIIEELTRKLTGLNGTTDGGDIMAKISSNLDVIRSTELLKLTKSVDRRDSARMSIYSISSINESVCSEPAENKGSHEDTSGEEHDSENISASAESRSSKSLSTSLEGVWSIPLSSTPEENIAEPVVYISPHDFRLSTLLPYDIIPKNTEPSICDNVIDEVISLIRPTTVQVNFRQSIKEFSSKVIRNTLGTHAFESGYFSLRCFLPDDPIRFCIFLSKTYENNWGLLLSEKLVQLAGGADETVFTSDEALDLDIEYDEEITRSITDVNHSQTTGIGRVHFIVELLPTEVFGNDRSDLCFVAFLEELDQLVGRSHLFKRSLLLIRAWWIYESPSYIGTNPRSILSDEAFVVLICAVFNQYHHLISSPLQALVIFLAEYSGFDWSKYAVSVHGAIILPDTQTDTVISVSLADAMNSSTQLLQPSIIKKHRVVYCAGEAAPEKSNFSVINITSKPEEKGSSKCFDRFPEVFRVKSMNIISPFYPTINMVSNNVSAKKLQQFIRIVEIGAKNFGSFLTLFKEGTVSSQSIARNAFQNVFARFGSGWKPDSPPKRSPTKTESSVVENKTSVQLLLIVPLILF